MTNEQSPLFALVASQPDEALNPELSPLHLHTAMPTHHPELSPSLSPTTLRREQGRVDLKPHSTWYLEEGTAQFLVQDTLYRVFKRSFCLSPWFRQAFRRAEALVKDHPKEDQLLPGWEAYEGRRNTLFYINWDRQEVLTAIAPVVPRNYSNVIVLYDIQTADFDALLSVLYPSDVDKGDITTKEQWTSVLKLSTFWTFESARSRAIRELADYTSSAERIALAQEYNVSQWVGPALKDLCSRVESLSPDEVEQMPPKYVALVMEVREEVRSPQHPEGSDDLAKSIKRSLSRRLHKNTGGSKEQGASGDVREAPTQEAVVKTNEQTSDRLTERIQRSQEADGSSQPKRGSPQENPNVSSESTKGKAQEKDDDREVTTTENEGRTRQQGTKTEERAREGRPRRGAYKS